MNVVLLLGCAVAIYLSCEWFVNGVEWLGRRLQLGTMAVGTVLAAFGTALPESIVTFVAVVLGDSEEKRDVGVGAALGGPLALATIAYGTVGIMLLLRHRAKKPLGDAPVPAELPDYDPGDLTKLRTDQQWFVVLFIVKVALGLVVFSWKPWFGALFFLAYGAYFWRQLREESDGHEEELEPLKLQPRRASPALWAVLVQTGVMVAVIFFASQLFVHQLGVLGPKIGLPSAVVALLLAPIATELPEVMNAIIWVRQGKTSLALANISGSMMIQVTVPTGLALIFTSWDLDGPLILAGAVTLASIGYLMLLAATKHFTPLPIALAAGFYLIFAAALVPMLI